MAMILRARGVITQFNGRRQLSLESLEARQLMAADSVMTWNEHLNEVVQLDSVQRGPTKSSRAYAMVQIAVYDAVNAITQTHTPFALTTTAPQTASIDAAVAAAARTAMLQLYPAQQALIDGWYQADLAAIPDGQAEDDGVAIGELAGSLCVDLREVDGSDATKLYRPNKAPGHWRPDPTILASPQMALDPAWGGVKPFILDSKTQFVLPPPPALNSAAYATALNEVKSLGDVNSVTRTQDQTEIGLFWAYDRPNFGPPLVLYNENLIEIATAKGSSVEDNVRLFALANIAMADAGIAIWHYKYVYDFWRPISGIREAAKDNNPLTVADPNWVPLGAPGNGTTIPDFTPPFPAYGSGHAGFGAALFETLTNFYGSDSFNYTLHSDEGGGLVRNFTSFSQAADENGRSRIYLGVHWEFDNVNSQAQGRQIADFVTDRLFLPVGQGDTLVSIRKTGGGLQTVSLADDVNLSIRRVAANIQIVNQLDNSVIFNTPMAQLEHVSIDGNNGSANNVVIAFTSSQNKPFTIDITGGTGDGDAVTFIGTADPDPLRLADDLLEVAAVGPYIYLPGVEFLTLAGRAGNDTFQISGDQTGRTLNLQGEGGNDQFKISSTGATLNIAETVGTELLSFATATAAVELNLALNAGQSQAAAGGNTVHLTGLFENLDGSSLADKLTGNALGNKIQGLNGNDIIQGAGGNDSLEGNDGDDIILGGVGLDKLYGGNGRDLLIGGSQTDLLYGNTGDDILIGGNTTHDGSEAALLDIMAEWTSANSNLDRVNNLKNGTGVAPKNNGTTYLDATTVLNDGAVDSLFANTGDFVLKLNPDLQLKG